MEFTKSLHNLPRISFSDISRIINEVSVAKTSKAEKVYKLFFEEYIFQFEVSNTMPEGVTVRARCHRSMRKNEEPHTVQVTLHATQVPVEVMKTLCTCVAGKAFCNHTVALLYQSAHYSTMGFKTVPLPVACTSTLQTWHRPRTQGIQPESTCDMEVRKPKSTSRTGVKSTLYQAYPGPFPDPHMLELAEKMRNMRPQPGVCKFLLNRDEDLLMVDSKFGPVPYGSVLSYQCPSESESEVIKHPDAPKYPQLPIENYRFQSKFDFTPNYKQKCHLESLKVTTPQAAMIEERTRQQSSSQLWFEVRRPRITASRFREVCHVCGKSSSQALATRILKGTPQTRDMKRGQELESDVLKQYSDARNVSVLPCGVIIHPDAPYLGASPDARVYDPTASPPFGLAEVKCCNVASVLEVKHLKVVAGEATLKPSHKYFWQVQGQLAITGLQWCDFITDTHNDVTIQRILRDQGLITSMREKLDTFYHHVYMDVYLNIKDKV
ncbi:uncharacterized protein LOC125804569 isoform X1 [Astyanax mexicanus]|uniref:uncharacterized protein LOC125804569 isoform X1 n=2 Tax=Astyanax mexicanus TaxID=7994 RepID=UPI0020CB6907|nr:uncharacterized protein LOC125804569 isoform X1 [Astyanax mexicanus]